MLQSHSMVLCSAQRIVLNKLSAPSFLPACKVFVTFFFFFNDTATTEISTLPLHDALPISPRRLELEKPLGLGLLGLSAFLFIGALTIVRGAVRESVLAPGQAPDQRRTVRAWMATAASAAVLALALIGGRAWWNAVDAAYASGLFQPLHGTATVGEAPGGGRGLRFTIDDTSWTDRQRQWTPLIPDHGHLMHLFLVRKESLDGFAHLHPLPRDSTTFEATVPPLPPGSYRLYADIVHES